jgi:hypothetical protein
MVLAGAHVLITYGSIMMLVMLVIFLSLLSSLATEG